MLNVVSESLTPPNHFLSLFSEMLCPELLLSLTKLFWVHAELSYYSKTKQQQQQQIFRVQVHEWEMMTGMEVSDVKTTR